MHLCVCLHNGHHHGFQTHAAQSKMVSAYLVSMIAAILLTPLRNSASQITALTTCDPLVAMKTQSCSMVVITTGFVRHLPGSRHSLWLSDRLQILLDTCLMVYVVIWGTLPASKEKKVWGLQSDQVFGRCTDQCV